MVNTLKPKWSNAAIFTSLKRDKHKHKHPAEESYKFQSVHGMPGESHDDKNARIGRPLSPHLSIYRPQLCSMTSIFHRITGDHIFYVIAIA